LSFSRFHGYIAHMSTSPVAASPDSAMEHPHPPNKRADWDEYFMRIASQVATRSTCDRKHVGAVIVRSKMILATGYNGSIRGLDHCDDVGHLMEGGHCVRTVHAEANAIVQAARSGTSVEGATIFVTASPCFNCFKLIANAGIQTIAYGEFYRDEKIYAFSKAMGIELCEVGGA
jgi:dCMP deaminase